MEYKKLGANVRKYRKIAGLTQEELAEIIGCSNSHIGKLKMDEVFRVWIRWSR